MRKYFDVVFYNTSLPAVGAKVFVYNADGTLATLYSDNATTPTPTTNPLTTDETGFYWFYVANGNYKLQYVQGSTTLRMLTDVQIYDESNGTPIPPVDFGQLMLAWFATLPTDLPSSPGIFWNNGGVATLS